MEEKNIHFFFQSFHSSCQDSAVSLPQFLISHPFLDRIPCLSLINVRLKCTFEKKHKTEKIKNGFCSNKVFLSEERERERERKEYFLISELGLCSHYLKVRTNKTWTRYHAEPICQLGVVHSDVFGVAIAA